MQEQECLANAEEELVENSSHKEFMKLQSTAPGAKALELIGVMRCELKRHGKSRFVLPQRLKAH